MAMEPDKLEAKTKDRLDELMKDPAIDYLRESFAHLPIWAMTGGAISYFFIDYALKTNRIAPKSPRLARAGMIVFGLFGGIQTGLWKMRHDYLKLDPKQEKVNELRSLLIERSKNRPDGICPKDISNESTLNNAAKPNTHDQLPRTNKYGDIIEEDK